MLWRGCNGALPPSNTYHARPTPTAGSIRVVGRQRSGPCLGSFHRCSALYPIYTSRRLRAPSRVTTACSSARTACLTPAELASIVKRFTATAPAPLPFHGQHRPPPPHGCALQCYPKCCYTVPGCIFCYAVHPCRPSRWLAGTSTTANWLYTPCFPTAVWLCGTTGRHPRPTLLRPLWAYSLGVATPITSLSVTGFLTTA